MISGVLKRFAKKQGLKVEKGVVTGLVQGYYVTLSEGRGVKTLSVATAFSDDNQKSALLLELMDKDFKKKHRLADVKTQGNTITVDFTDSYGTIKKIQAFLDDVMPRLSSAGALGERHCPLCGQSLASGSSSRVIVDRVYMTAHDSCINAYENEQVAAMEDITSKPARVIPGIIGAILGGLIGSIPWIVAYYFGWFVGLFAVFIALGAKKGYELFGGRPSKVKAFVIAIVSLACVFATYYVAIFAALYIAFLDYPGVTFGMIGELVNLFLSDPEYLLEILFDLGLGLLFAIFGIVPVFREARSEVELKRVTRLESDQTSTAFAQ